MTIAEPDLPASPAPAPPEAEFAPLDPRVVTVWRLAGVVWTVVVSTAATIVGLVADRPLLVVLPVAVLCALWVAAWPPKRYERWRWRVGEADVRIAQGVLWRRETVVLHSRIQHVDTHQGPIERMFGLAQVVIYTAGHVGGVVAIPGLAAGEAEALRDRLAVLSGSEDDAV